MRFARFAPLLAAASLLGLQACSLLTGKQDVPPPWNSSAQTAPAPGAHLPPPVLTRLPEPVASALAPAPAVPAPRLTPAMPYPVESPMPGPQSVPAVAGTSPAIPSMRTVPREQAYADIPGFGTAPPAAFGDPQTVATVPAATGPAGYVLGVGDTVEVSVYGQPDLSTKAIVSDDGSVALALIGRTPIAGLTPAQASERIGAAFRQGQYLVNPQVSVTLQQFLSQQISVLGDVKNPGRFPVSVRLTVLDALALAGGVTDTGSQHIYVLRPEGRRGSGGTVTRYEIDIDALLDAGVGQEYFDVQAGDTLVVPRAEVFYIYGEVRLPNAYKLRPDMTVMQAISLGGGLTDKGSDHRLQLRRRGPDGQIEMQSAHLTDRVEPDDVIYVRERLF